MRVRFAIFLSLGLMLALAAGSQAATIPERLVYEAERIDETRVGVSPAGEGMIVVRVETSGLPKLLARSRGLDGTLGLAVPLSETGNAGMPTNVVFDSLGNLFLSWGVGTVAAKGEYVSRTAAGAFSATGTFTTPACERFQSASAKPDGGLLLACSSTAGVAPLDDTLLVTGLPNLLSTSFESATVAQTATDDAFILPLTDVAPDGTMAVGWATVRENPPGTFASRIRAMVSGDGDWVGSSATNLAFVNSPTGLVSGARVVALSGGRAAIMWREETDDPSFGRIHIGILNSAGVIESSEIIGFKPSYSYSAVREGEGLRLAWTETDGGMGDLSTTKTAHYSLASGLSDLVVLESNADTGAGFLQRNSRGDILLPRGNGENISAWIKKAGASSFSAPQTIENYSPSPDERISGVSLDLSESGDVMASWILVNDTGVNPDIVYWGGLDFTRPSVRIRVPRRITPGRKVRLQAIARDTSGIRIIRWRIGSTNKTGSRIGHRFRRSGRATIRLTATDRAGLKRTVTKRVRVR